MLRTRLSRKTKLSKQKQKLWPDYCTKLSGDHKSSQGQWMHQIWYVNLMVGKVRISKVIILLSTYLELCCSNFWNKKKRLECKIIQWQYTIIAKDDVVEKNREIKGAKPRNTFSKFQGNLPLRSQQFLNFLQTFASSDHLGTKNSKLMFKANVTQIYSKNGVKEKISPCTIRKVRGSCRWKTGAWSEGLDQCSPSASGASNCHRAGRKSFWTAVNAQCILSFWLHFHQWV